MNAFDPYAWREDALKALLSSPDLNEEFVKALRKGDPALLDVTIERFDLLLSINRSAGTHAKGTGKATGISTIARGAVLVLMNCEENGLPPPNSLIHLFRRLLKVDRYQTEASRAVWAQNYAVLVVRLIPDITPVELSEEVEVSRWTARRWLKDPDFQRRVSEITEAEAEGFLSKPKADDVRLRISEQRRTSQV